MAEVIGAGLYIKFGTTVLNTDYRTFAPEQRIGTVLAAAGADTVDTFLTLRKSGEGPLTILIQADDTTTWGAVAEGTEATLEWGDQGTASGKPKHTVLAIITSRRKDYSYEDVIVATLTFLFNAAVSDTAYGG